MVIIVLAVKASLLAESDNNITKVLTITDYLELTIIINTYVTSNSSVTLFKKLEKQNF